MERFSVDESGYTGFDLLNSDQRFQGASAISISDQEAARLIKEHFPKLRAPEMKYGALARRPGSRGTAVGAARQPPEERRELGIGKSTLPAHLGCAPAR